jgi:hypothetical protein
LSVAEGNEGGFNAESAELGAQRTRSWFDLGRVEIEEG